MSTPVLEVNDLKVHFPIGGGLIGKPKAWVRAVDGISFSVPRGTTFGIVGESGSGKSTTALAVMRLVKHTAGEILLDGEDIGRAEGETLRRARKRFQMVFQDPYASLNPRKRAGDAVREALQLMQAGAPDTFDARVAELFAQTGLRPEQQMLFPHQFSGGQRQRIVLARALGSKDGAADHKASVYGCSGREKRDSRAACSTMTPRYITATWSHMWRMTPRSCEMNR